MQHAKLSASGSSRWLSCPASIKASEQYGESTNSSAEWGTACHEVGEMVLKDLDIPKEVNGLEVTAEMLETAEDYAQYCRALGIAEVEMIEQRMDFSHIVPEGFGTGDYTALIDGTLHIVDLKTGHHLVDAEENSQLMLYAIGAIRELEAIYDINRVVLHICQSRANHYSDWETTPEHLAEWGKWVSERANLALTDDAPFSPSKKACQWCPHQVNCKALKDHVDNAVKGQFDNFEDLEGNADKIDLEHVKSILDNADLIVGFVKAVQEVALERMEGGETIDGYKLVESRTNRKWKDESEVEALLNGEEIHVKKLKPMTKILKEFGKDYDLEALLIKPEGKPVVAPESDKRNAITSVCDQFD